MKKILYMIMSLVIMAATMIFIGTIAYAASTPAITIDNVSAEPDSTVVVPVRISGNTGIAGALISVNYNSALELTQVTKGSALFSLNMIVSGDLKANPVKIGYDGVVADTSNGVIFNLTFKAPATAGKYEVSAVVANGDAVDNNLSLLSVASTAGSVTVAKPVDENAPCVTVANVKTLPGKEVKVTVSLAKNTGFANLGIEVGYNSDVMTLTNVETEGVGGTFTEAPNYSVNPYNMTWDSAKDITFNGTLATLTFNVKADAPDGNYPITVDYYKGRNGNYIDGDSVNFDADFNPLGLAYADGSVIVASYTPGDITGDGTVNNKDATFLLRYLAGWNPEGIVTEALDVNGSGAVDNKDATILLRYLAGWDVTLH